MHRFVYVGLSICRFVDISVYRYVAISIRSIGIFFGLSVSVCRYSGLSISVYLCGDVSIYWFIYSGLSIYRYVDTRYRFIDMSRCGCKVAKGSPTRSTLKGSADMCVSLCIYIYMHVYIYICIFHRHMLPIIRTSKTCACQGAQTIQP